MTNQTSATQNKSISEYQVCVRLNRGPRYIFNQRKAGKMPPHFRDGKQVRYYLKDIVAFEKQLAQESAKTLSQ